MVPSRETLPRICTKSNRPVRLFITRLILLLQSVRNFSRSKGTQVFARNFRSRRLSGSEIYGRALGDLVFRIRVAG